MEKRLPYRMVMHTAEQPISKNYNTLLLKDDVGRAKPTIYDLPGDKHKYGVSSPKRDFIFKSGKFFPIDIDCLVAR